MRAISAAVLEYMEGGEVKWRTQPPDEFPTLEVEQIRKIFRQVILGLEYRELFLYYFEVYTKLPGLVCVLLRSG